MTTGSPVPGPKSMAYGLRSVAADQVTGIVATGDNAQINARTVVLSAGVPRPGDVEVKPGMNNLPRPPTRVFVGREKALSLLEQALSERATAVVTQAVYGGCVSLTGMNIC
jgi:hypothetical protein